MLKKSKFKFLILSSKYRYKSKIEKDYYYHITNSLEYLNYKFLLVQFDKKNNIKNIKEIKSFLKKRNVIILAEANIEYNYLYPNTFLDLIKKTKHKIISFFADFDKNQIKSIFIEFSDFVLMFDKTYVDWCNKNLTKNKFYYIHSFPMEKKTNYSLSNFKSRYYDIFYSGSKKNFRYNFINSFFKLCGKKYLFFFNFIDDKNLISNDFSPYVNTLIKSKFYFCTRAGLYENDPFSQFSYREGRYSGRISEAISAGCIPIYWQPKKPNNFLLKFILKNRFRRFKYLNSFFMGDKNSRPYDVFDENFKDMMLIVDSPQDLIDQISSLTENQISRKLQLMNIFYRKFIFPNVFFKKIFNLVLAK